MNILECMNDPALFGKTFRRGLLRDSWKAWRAFLSAVFGLPLDAEGLKTFRKHTGRVDAPTEPFSEVYAICGRRSGKSLIAAMTATYLAAFRDYEAILAPGDIGVLPIIAPDRKQCRVILNYIAGFFEASPALASMVKVRLKESIELNNRIRIEVHTASFRSVRGYTCVGGVLDETAFFPNENSASPDVELLAALRPSMVTVPGALLLCISSPYSRRGVLWEQYRAHFGKNDSTTLIWQSESRAMNPTLNPLIVQAALLRDRAAASSEYLATFRTDVESFIPEEIVEACTVAGRRELPPLNGVSYTGFCDPSGGQADSFTLAIAHSEKELIVLDLVREVPAPFSPEGVVTEFAGILKHYHCHEVTGDRYAGEWPREQFQKRGITYKPSEKNRSEIYLEVLPMLTSARVMLLDHARLKNQFAGLERRTGHGRDMIDHAPGSHDDVANAAAGALVLALASNGGVLGVFEYEKMLAAGTLPKAEFKFDKNYLFQFEQKVRGLQPSNADLWKEDPIPACPQCNATCTTRLSGAEYRCQQCGCQYWKDGHEPPAPNGQRGLYLAGLAKAKVFKYPGQR